MAPLPLVSILAGCNASADLRHFPPYYRLPWDSLEKPWLFVSELSQCRTLSLGFQSLGTSVLIILLFTYLGDLGPICLTFQGCFLSSRDVGELCVLKDSKQKALCKEGFECCALSSLVAEGDRAPEEFFAGGNESA